MSAASLDPARPAEAGPRLPLLLGFAGLIPFWGLAIAHVTGRLPGVYAEEVAGLLATYAATIISFLGGIRWGLALREPGAGDAPAAYVVSVVPQLLAWAALALPDPWRFAALGLLILVLGPLDRRLVARGWAPPWFGRLRLWLSLGAGAALLLAALA